MVLTPEELREARTLKGLSQTEVAELIGVSLKSYQFYESGQRNPKIDKVNKLIEVLEMQKTIVPNKSSYLEERLRAKNEENYEEDGIIYVPISAQAGYGKRIIDPMFKSALQKLFIPGMPYRGERYRIFEVEGNSMEPTFKEHFHLLTENIEPEYWIKPKDYYAYVLITEESVLLKRVFKKNSKEWVLISDNEELYPQILFNVEELKELWIVKRKMDWEMAPPKKFEINI